jgi:hypothetical protein
VSWSELADATYLSESAVRRAAARWYASPGSEGLPAEEMRLAIDSAGTRIREDAFRVGSLRDGSWLIEVSTPTVDDVVLRDGVLDREARERVSVTERDGARRGMLPARSSLASSPSKTISNASWSATPPKRSIDSPARPHS